MPKIFNIQLSGGGKKQKAKQSMFLKSTGITVKLHFIMDVKAIQVIKKMVKVYVELQYTHSILA